MADTELPVALTVDDVEKIIIDTEPREMSDRGDKIWTRRMAVALHERLTTPTPVPDAEGHKRGVEAVASKIRSPSTFPGETATKVAIELVAAYLEASGAVLCDAQPVAFTTPDVMQSLQAGHSGLFAMSGKCGPSHRPDCTIPLYARSPSTSQTSEA